MSMLIDSHCHLPTNKEKLLQIIKNARAANVTKIINIGTNLKTSKKALTIAQQFPDVYATVGIYPHDEKNTSIQTLKQNMEPLLTQPKVVAIGECGIDITSWRKHQRSLESQLELFEMQIKLSIKHNLPLVIHNRNGNTQILKMLQKHSQARGVIHCFSTDWAFAQKILDLGLYISFSGTITYPSGDDILETVKKVPLDRFLVETDAPCLTPQQGAVSPRRNKQNEPKYVRLIAAKIAAVKNLSLEEICTLSYKNTCILFGLYDNQNS
jgi:TatD DNase family protein